MASVTFDAVTRRYPGAERPALDSLDLSVRDGEFMVLVGPSGCGKTTTLRVLAGLEPVDTGHIFIGSDEVTETDPGHRDIAMVFQNYALYPHMTVAQNMGFALKVAKTPKAEIRARVLEVAQLLGLQDHLQRKPKDLSGGERQRVAMGRAIVRRPQVFLMDEPLSNLDAMLRAQTRNQVAELQRRLGITTVYVTHDQVEAMTMGDRVAVLRDGVLQQCAPPRELYRNPANVFVAGFIGSPAMNLFTVPVVDGAVSLGGYTLAVPREIATHETELVIGVRPEHLVLDGGGADVDVELVEELGADTYVYGRVIESGGASRRAVTARVAGDSSLRRDDRVRLRPDPEHVHFFSADGVRLGL
ncbi:ABC transporter ATP-binding protein [Mycolicibacter senuensis]|uniref:Trehalose import ATP-binding protein SugC n=1 Tax=Mycolicibacter senuensis TaxID=386913 RepID=A0A7I9XI86_9MYCO|nr:sn-glycerol-3-phosphate ABC transporter ATP-binding protein UgpC [Mycolicibacter senuensis]ORW67068.1 sugar ABC transporter ATP-binding protein [Mycolicibacter senuensis]GFG69478.1 sugar ABC transporter ATP-binding protein [Mycolicibacter senuensis]